MKQNIVRKNIILSYLYKLCVLTFIIFQLFCLSS